MTFIDNFTDLMTSTVLAFPRVGGTGYGTPTYDGYPRNNGYPCYIEAKNVLDAAGSGREEYVVTQLYIKSTGIADTDGLVIDGTLYTINNIVTYYDEDGPSYQIASVT